MLLKCKNGIVLALLILQMFSITGCSSKDTDQSLAGLYTVSAIIAAALLSPFTDVYHSIVGAGRTLYVDNVYLNDNGEIAIDNANGWFTDKERVSQSAWVINIESCKKDKKGRIILSDRNLDRYFYKDFDSSEWISIPRNYSKSSDSYFKMTNNHTSITLHATDGKSYIFHLKQSGNF